MAPYPGSSCLVAPGCASGATPEQLSELPSGLLRSPGLVWLTRADVHGLAPDPGALAYVLNLKLADPDSDGTLDKAEYLALVEARFKAADPDNDGTLGAKELKTPTGKALVKLLK